MRILFVVPYVPDPIRVRPYHFIRSLAALGHELTLMTLVSSKWEETSLEALEGGPEQIFSFPLSVPRRFVNVISSIFSSHPMQATYCWQPALAHQVKTAIKQSQEQGKPFDVVHVEHLRGALYGLHALTVREGLQSNTPIVWDSVDCITELFRQAAEQSRTFMGRWVTRLEIPKTANFERDMLDRFDRVLVTSQSDRTSLLNLGRAVVDENIIQAVPNGVDSEFFSPPADNRRSNKKIVLSGKMSYHANVSMVMHFVEDVFPKVLREIPDAELVIVGKDPTPEISTLARHHAIKVTGTVPDMRPYLWQAAVAVAPLTYAVGIQNKVLEAMAAGAPVVMSPKAQEGIEVEDGVHSLIREDPQEFADAVIRLMRNKELSHRMTTNARKFIETNHSWPSIGRTLEGIYYELTESND